MPIELKSIAVQYGNDFATERSDEKERSVHQYNIL